MKGGSGINLGRVDQGLIEEEGDQGLIYVRGRSGINLCKGWIRD